QLDVDAAGEAPRADLGFHVLELVLRKRDAVRFHAIPLGGMEKKRTPAAPDVEKAVARLQTELAADVINLAGLRGIERRVLGPEVGTAVDELPVEPQPVERIGDVVVIADVRPVGAMLVPPDPPARAERIASVRHLPDHVLGYAERPPRAAGEVDVVVDVRT